MNYGPRFSIENGGPVLFVVVGRVVAHLQERFDGNQLALIEQVQVPGIYRASLDFLVAQRGVAKELPVAVGRAQRPKIERFATPCSSPSFQMNWPRTSNLLLDDSDGED